MRTHGVSFHQYADDTQIYYTFSTSDSSDLEHAKLKLEMCLRDINVWMLHNNLQLNDDKIKILVFHAKQGPAPYLDCMQVASAELKPSEHARNIGVIFDPHVSLDRQIASVCKSAFYSY